MEEVIPLVLGACQGAIIWLSFRGATRLALSPVAVVVAAFVATVLSGEYQQSWAYLLFDLAEAAIGLAVGCVFAAWLIAPGKTLSRAEAGR